MKNNNLIRFVQSLVLLPVMSMSFSMSGTHNPEISQNILVKQFNIGSKSALVLKEASLKEADLNAQAQKAKADAIDNYFVSRKMPLAGTGKKMVIEAEKNGLDWRLLPAIAVRESTGGKNACVKVKNNSFGWGSCKIGFKSNDESIETIARNLGGNNPKTARHYDNKTTKQILNAYNPPSIIPRYTEQVLSIMNAIGDTDVVVISTPVSNT